MTRRVHSGSLAGRSDYLVSDNTPAETKTHLPVHRSSRTPGRINLRAVAEVLAARGLDPTEELVDIVDAVDDRGRPILDPEVRARILNELLQYTQPKLKSIEVRGKVAATSFDINDEQAKKIAEEWLKASGESGGI
jgi:hypothetical protein